MDQASLKPVSSALQAYKKIEVSLVASLDMPSQKQIKKLLMRLRGCAGLSAPLLLQITEDSFSQSQSNCYMSFYHERVESKMKYGITKTELLLAQYLKSICSVYVDRPRIILLVTLFFIIQPNTRK